jgi:uncharacterized protein
LGVGSGASVNKILATLLVGLMLAVGGGVATAGPYEDGSAAYERGEYATALRLFRPLADQGNAQAQYKIGLMYRNGEGVAQDRAEAAKWIHKAAEQGSMYAQRDLASKYYNGEGVAQDRAEAAKWFGKAADQGDRVSQTILGKMYGKGEGVPQNNILAYKWLSLSAAQGSQSAEEELRDISAAMTPDQIAEAMARIAKAQGGDAQAQIEMGIRYLQGKGVTQDLPEAAKWFRLAADKGNTEALSALGAIFHDGGKGVAQDYREAAKWYRLAAQKGDVDAEDTLGDIFYRGGAGVTQDFKEAAKWYRLAADHGNAEAQLRFGYMNYNGQGVTQDYKQAMKWYRLSANQGNADAQFFLGIMYDEGKGVVQDYREAVKWHRLAAQQGMPRAQLSLGLRYRNDREGVDQDNQYAYMWLSLAASKLDGEFGPLGEVAAQSRNGAAKEMTAGEVLVAQAMAKLCEETNYKKCDKIEANQSGSSVTSVSMKGESGTYVVPVLINNAITLDFVLDSGASDVSIPADVVTTLMRTGTLKQSDFLDQKTYRLADGSTVPSQTFRIRSLKVGSKVIENVNGSVASVKGTLLLGQSFLSRFKSWSIDNNKHALVLE